MVQVQLALNPPLLTSPVIVLGTPLKLCTRGCFICVHFTFLANSSGNVLQLPWI